ADRLARAAHVVATLAEIRDRRERHVELVRVLGGEPRRALGAPAAEDDRRVRLLYGLRKRGGVGARVMLPRERVGLTRRRVPKPGHDLELLLEHLEARTCGRERDRVRRVLAVVPARAQPQLDA